MTQVLLWNVRSGSHSCLLNVFFRQLNFFALKVLREAVHSQSAPLDYFPATSTGRNKAEIMIYLI